MKTKPLQTGDRYENKRSPYSTHAFMLPFRWDYSPTNSIVNEFSFDQRTNLSEIHKILTEQGDSKWVRKHFKIETNPSNFNELTYFHSYVWPAIYDINNHDEKGEAEVGRNKMILYYEWLTEDNDYYKIYTQNNDYKLNLDGISLHVFNTGVAIITYNCSNWISDNKDDILHINEFGRRFYPQFISQEGSNLIDKVKNTFLAKKIELKLNGHDDIISEDFEIYNSFDNLKTPQFQNGVFSNNTIIHPPAFFKKLFSDNCVYSKDNQGEGKIRFRIISDDRMFFQCWYGNDLLASHHKIMSENFENIEYKWMHSNWWYCYIFGDKERAGIANRKMLCDHLKRHTYPRWSEYGTIFGLSRDSFVCLSQNSQTLKENGAPDLLNHMKSMYYQIAILCLVQRASILKFSAEVSTLGDLARDDQKNLPDLIKNLYLNYIEFINKLYFREITSQIQGIEIYSQLQDVMNIHRDVKDLDGEIEELHLFANLLLQEEQTKETKLRTDEAHNLTKVATILLPFTVIAGLFGMNFFPPELPEYIFNGRFYPAIWIGLVLTLILSIGILIGVDSYLQLGIIVKRKKK